MTTAHSVTKRTHYISSLTSVRFDRRGRFASKRGRFDWGRFEYGTFWLWDVLTMGRFDWIPLERRIAAKSVHTGCCAVLCRGAPYQSVNTAFVWILVADVDPVQLNMSCWEPYFTLTDRPSLIGNSSFWFTTFWIDRVWLFPVKFYWNHDWNLSEPWTWSERRFSDCDFWVTVLFIILLTIDN